MARDRIALLISPYFLPSNLAGVHRVRLMSEGLPAHGWRPVIVTVDAAHYEAGNDPSLANLIPAHVEIERVGAWPLSLARRVAVGDISLRAQWTLRRRVGELVGRLQPDVVFATVLPGYTALIGAWAKRRFKIPFVLDYQDPWVPDGSTTTRWDKAGVAQRLAR